MDIDDFRSVVEATGVDVWTFIDTAITVAATDYGEELKLRRDKIVETLYMRNDTSNVRNVVINGGRGEVKAEASRRGKEGGSDGGDNNGNNNNYKDGDSGREGKRGVGSPSTPPRSVHGEDEEERDDDGDGGRGSGEEEVDELDPYGGLFDDEQKKILDIKQQLEDPDQAEDTVVDLLQCLADMDITFPALKETDIGRNVNRLRKHPSNDVRRLVKQLVRKWKEIVDDWVRLSPQGDHSSSALMVDGDSPQQKVPQNGHHQVPDFACSPNLNNGSSRADKNNSEPERIQKPILQKESPIMPAQQPVSASASASAPHNLQRQREQPKESNFDADDRLASARKRLQANYKEAENAKRQRTIQVMDIHEIPKPKNAKNAFFAKNKGGQGRLW